MQPWAKATQAIEEAWEPKQPDETKGQRVGFDLVAQAKLLLNSFAELLMRKVLHQVLEHARLILSCS